MLDVHLQYPRVAIPALTLTALDMRRAEDLALIPSGTDGYTLFDALFGTPEEMAGFARLSGGFSAIEQGTALGTLTNAGPLDDLFSIEINSLGLDLIDQSSGLLGFGLTWTPTFDVKVIGGLGAVETGFDSIVFSSAPVPRLTQGSVDVPSPGSLLLVISALLLLARHYSNRNRLQKIADCK